MKYYRNGEEVTKERAKFILEGCYKSEAVKDIIDKEKAFRLRIMTGEIYTEDEYGRVPMPGFFGVCE